MSTVYVSNTATNGYAVGSDANTYAQSQNKATPKLTIASAISVLNAGDTLIINGGAYVEANYINPADINLTISAENGTAVIIRNNTPGVRVVHVPSTATGIIFNGITFDGYNQDGCITAQKTTTNVANCSFNNCVFLNFFLYGIRTEGTGIENLSASGCVFSTSRPTGLAYGIFSVQPASGTFTITGCSFSLTNLQQSGAAYGAFINSSGILDVIINNCVFDLSSNQTVTCIRLINLQSAYISQNNYQLLSPIKSYGNNLSGCTSVVIELCNIDLGYSALVAGVAVENDARACTKCWILCNSIECNSSPGYGIMVGADGEPAVANIISGVEISYNNISNSNHGILVGFITSALVYKNSISNTAIGVIGKSSISCVFDSNIINGVTSSSGGLRAKGGTNDIFINNIVYVKSSDSLLSIPCLVNANDSPATASTGIVVKNNVMVCAGEQLLVSVVTGSDATFTDNTYFSPNGESAGMWTDGATAYDTLASWNATLIATDELFVDPLFFDAANGDLRILNTSPLVAAGLATVTREPLSSTLENNTPGPLNVSATITAGTTYPDITIKAPLGPEFQEIAEWTGGAAVDLSTFAGSNYTRVGERGMMIYGSERTAAEIVAIDRYLGVV